MEQNFLDYLIKTFNEINYNLTNNKTGFSKRVTDAMALLDEDTLFILFAEQGITDKAIVSDICLTLLDDYDNWIRTGKRNQELWELKKWVQ